MTDERYALQRKLEKWLSKVQRIVIAGIGNPIRMDDFVGVKIVQDLRGKVSEKVYLIECETVPESFMQQIVDFNPTHVLIIDAALLGLEPGKAKLVFPEDLATFPAFSTHMLPLRLFCEYVAKIAGAKTALLLIQPKNAEFGEGLTAQIEASAKKIVSLLVNVLP